MLRIGALSWRPPFLAPAPQDHAERLITKRHSNQSTSRVSTWTIPQLRDAWSSISPARNSGSERAATIGSNAFGDHQGSVAKKPCSYSDITRPAQPCTRPVRLRACIRDLELLPPLRTLRHAGRWTTSILDERVLNGLKETTTPWRSHRDHLCSRFRP